MKTVPFKQIFDYKSGYFICNNLSLLKQNIITNKRDFYLCKIYQSDSLICWSYVTFDSVNRVGYDDGFYINSDLFKINFAFSIKHPTISVLFDEMLETENPKFFLKLRGGEFVMYPEVSNYWGNTFKAELPLSEFVFIDGN